ncbi:uncharacterized protein [Amphiura filiformis]|uniref:uncharacterized protein n=1 Tax=Amphiura filiformis TaxID=82378 RepID=UPI003B20E7D6
MYNAEQMKLHVAQQHKCTICLCLFSKNELREHIYSRHKCVLCNDLVNYDSYEQHIDSKHRCAYCQLFFQNVSDHIVKCHKCPMCKYMFLEKKYMLAHVNGAHVQDSPCEGMITVLKDILGSQIYHCEDCFRVFDSECKMNFHRLTSSSHKCIDQLECATCETVFETHAKDHTLNKIKRHECMKGHCAFSKTCTLAASDPVQHLTIRSTEYLPKQAVLSVTCKHCQVDFPDIHMLASHRKHNHAWPCPHCHLTFPWFHELKQHQDITYLCTICDKEVSCKEEHMQKEHKSMIAHGDNILPHRCSFCNRRFSNETFMDHFLSNHKCHFCNSYHTTEMLSAHVVSKHLCVSCQRAFEDLFMHMALEHNCWHCNQFFQTKELLIAHVNSVHVCYYCCLNLKGADCSENIDVAVEDSEASYKCSNCHSYFPESLIGCFMNSTSVCAFCVEVLSHFPITPQLAGRCEYRNCRAILAENQHVIHKRMFHKCPDCPKFFSCEKDCRSHVQKQHSLQAAKIDDVYKYKEANPYKNKNVVETSANDKETAQDISLYKVPVQDSCEQTDSNLIHVMPEKVVQANYQKSAIVVLQNQKQSLTNTNPVGNPVQQNPVYQTVIQKPKVNEILQNTVPQFANQQPRIARTIQNTFDQSVHQSLHQQQELNPILQKPLQQSWETLVVKRPAHNYNTRQKSVSQKNTVLQSPEQQSAESVKNELPVVVNGAVQSLEQQSVKSETTDSTHSHII